MSHGGRLLLHEAAGLLALKLRVLLRAGAATSTVACSRRSSSSSSSVPGRAAAASSASRLCSSQAPRTDDPPPPSSPPDPAADQAPGGEALARWKWEYGVRWLLAAACVAGPGVWGKCCLVHSLWGGAVPPRWTRSSMLCNCGAGRAAPSHPQPAANHAASTGHAAAEQLERDAHDAAAVP